jgi:hypothetical protein
MSTKDYKLDSLVPLMGLGQQSYSLMEMIAAIQTEGARPAAWTFGKNITRMEFLFCLPSFAAVLGCVHGQGTPLPPGPATNPDRTPIGRANDLETLKYGTWVLQQCSSALTFGIDAWLSALLLGTWTAFETLAGDLWVASVNAQPQYLAGLTGAADRIDGAAGAKPEPEKAGRAADDENGEKSADDDPCEPFGDKKVALGLMCKLTRGDYDLHSKMGHLLVETERVKFTSLKSIREAYSLAFSEKVKRARTHRIDAALAAPSLNALSAVRNLIVHKAGVADAAYVEDRKVAPTAPVLKEKEAIQLNGETCRILVEPVIKASVELVKAVDSWLTLTRR